MNTKAEPVDAVHASRDDVEIKETVELEKPESSKPEDPRMAIAKKYDKQRDAEVKAENEALAQGYEQEKELSEEVEKEQPADTIEDNEPETITIKVNGREMEVPKEKVDKAGGVAAYQKEVAVMQGFKDLAEQRKQLDEREKALQNREAELNELPKLDAKQSEAQNDPPPQGDPKTVDLIKQHREALLDGEDEVADKLMLEIIRSGQQPQQKVDTDKLVQKVKTETINELEVRDAKIEIATAKANFYKDHPELKTDDTLLNLVDMETVKVEEQNPEYTPKQILDTSWDNIQKWLGRPEQEKTTSIDEKEREKRAMNRPKPSTRRAEAPPEKPRQTRSSYVQQLQKQRGQTA